MDYRSAHALNELRELLPVLRLVPDLAYIAAALAERVASLEKRAGTCPWPRYTQLAARLAKLAPVAEPADSGVAAPPQIALEVRQRAQADIPDELCELLKAIVARLQWIEGLVLGSQPGAIAASLDACTQPLRQPMASAQSGEQSALPIAAASPSGTTEQELGEDDVLPPAGRIPGGPWRSVIADVLATMPEATAQEVRARLQPRGGKVPPVRTVRWHLAALRRPGNTLISTH